MNESGGGPTPITLAYEADLCGNIEQALKALHGYGLMALELIQNADDAKAKSLVFDVRRDGLVIHNDAEFSTCGLETKRCPWEASGDPEGAKRPCNFHAIAKMGSRNKVLTPDQIGRFGIGFVSVYQITDTPVVRSVGMQLQLNPLTGEAAVGKIRWEAGTTFELRWANVESEIRQALNASPTPPDVQKLFLSEVKETLRSSLLFLRHLEKVEIRRDGKVYFSASIVREKNRVGIRFEPEGFTERWLTLGRSAEDVIEEQELFDDYPALRKLHRSAQTTVALRLEGLPTNGLLYAYLPTQQSTNMPLHINADFFPHASRQHIVLQGEGHERYWNEALLASAAATLFENFDLLKEVLGAKHLWELLEAAFKLKDGAFGQFWSRLSIAARESDSVLTSSGEWAAPATIKLSPDYLPVGEQAALSQLGISILDKTLRPHWTVLSTLGGSELRLVNVAAALEGLGDDGLPPTHAGFRMLWSAVSSMIDGSQRRPDHTTVLRRLSQAKFLLDVNSCPVSPSAVCRLPFGVPKDLLRRFRPDCPLVDERVLEFPYLYGIIDEYGIQDLARGLAQAVTDENAAEDLIGAAGEDVRAFYSLLTAFPPPAPTCDIAEILADAPILRTPDGFVTPSRGQLPGGFHDPVGHFRFVDASLFTPEMESFARDVLNVSVLSFAEYITDHLADILDASPTQEQYQALLGEIVNHRNELDETCALDVLGELAFVRTRAGTFAKPADCYFKSGELELLLGNDDTLWVEDSWMPSPPRSSKFRDLLEARLGTPRTVSVKHLVGRIQDLSVEGGPEIVGRAVTPIIRHIIEMWPRFSEQDREDLTELRACEFLPAVIGSEPDDENLYPPEQVYRAVRATGFASQVPVVNVTALRQSSATVNELLDLWEMPTEPSTAEVVSHLEHCIRTGEAASDVTYAILSERLEDDDDADEIDRLVGEPFIFDAESDRFLKADQVFWRAPPFGEHWSAANNSMRRREALFTHLGVKVAPGPDDFAALILELAKQPLISEQDLHVHQACLSTLAEAFDNRDAGSDDALQVLATEECLLTVDAAPILPRDALWIDFEHLIDPFGTELNERLVEAPNVEYGVATRFFKRLGTKAVSDVVRLRLGEEPDGVPAPHAMSRLQERSPLLLWLAPNARSRSELSRILDGLDIRLTKSLRVRAEIDEFDEIIRSEVSDAPAFYDRETSVLHVRGAKVRTKEWAAAFRAVFAELEQYCASADLKPLVMSASALMAPETEEEAEEYLIESGFQAPQDTVLDIAPGQELADSPDIEPVADTGDFTGADDDASIAIDQCHVTELSADGPEHEVDADGVVHTSDANAGDSGKNTQAESGSDENATDSESLDEDAYASKRSAVAFGGAKADRTPAQSRPGDKQSHSNIAPRRQHKAGETLTERHARRSRMLAYVVQGGSRGSDDSEAGRTSEDVSELIDVAAMKAVLKYEENAGRQPIEQPHNNPGFDVSSTTTDAGRRLIEVKGLESEWTERGIKLSHVQYAMSREHPEEYWIYVVEYARDLQRQCVSAIKNPFQKVEEYWFDHNWRDVREEGAASRDLHFCVGAKVRHDVFGPGEVLEVVQRGFMKRLKIRFREDGGRLMLISPDHMLKPAE